MLFDSRRRRAWFSTRGVCLLLLLAAGPAAADVVIIANKHAPDTLSKEQVAEIFMGKSYSLPGGTPAAPLDLPASHPLREEFYTKVTGKSASQAKSYWAKMAFTGKGIPPREAEGSAEVKKAVAASPGGIGYIDRAAVDNSVKVVLTVQ